MKKGDILIKILEILEEGTLSGVDFIEAVLSSGYGANINKIEYEYRKRREKSVNQKLEAESLLEKRKRLQKFLSKLKKDGLISENNSEDKNKKFIISNKGKNKLKQLKNSVLSTNYQKETQNESVIISFDIPEKLRKKRNWLREVVKNFGFTMVHQSVWIGKVKIPAQFIIDLEKMNILEYVEIFEISKSGSLKKIGE
jgi:DNA-binding PadR family transcriptional regulator